MRLEEYDQLISKRFSSKEIFTAVVYIRETKLGDFGTLYNGRKIPYIKVQDYSMQELLDKKLYILLPYYVMRYENDIKNNNLSMYKTIVKELKALYNEIERINDIDLLKMNNFADTLRKMCVEITLRISKDSTFLDYLKKEGAMPMVWMTFEEEIEQAKRKALTAQKKGEKIGKEIGKEIGAFNMALENIKNAMDSFKLSFDEACDGLKIKDREQYRKFI